MAMSEANSSLWYVRGEGDEVFGPINTQTLLAWAKDSRIEPTFAVSHDREAWIPAPRVKELGMTWLVEPSAGTFYGPFNRAVVDGLLAAGTISREARLYLLNDGVAESERKRLQDEVELARSTIANLKEQAARQAETTKRTMAFMEAKLAELTESLRQTSSKADARVAAVQEEVFSGRERAEKAEARAEAEKRRAEKAEAELAALRQRFGVAESELADVRSQLESVTKFSSVKCAPSPLEPEVVVGSQNPLPKPGLPHSAKGANPAGLAALEAAARRELAAAKRQGLGIKDLFGGKK